LPPDSTQEQRIRLRKSYSLRPQSQLRPGGTVDESRFKHLPTQEVLRELGGALTSFDRFIAWAGPGDDRWKEVDLLGGGDRPRVPCLHVNTWHDVGLGEMVRLFTHLQDLGTPDQYLILAPGSHCSLSGELLSTLSAADLKK